MQRRGARRRVRHCRRASSGWQLERREQLTPRRGRRPVRHTKGKHAPPSAIATATAARTAAAAASGEQLDGEAATALKDSERRVRRSEQ